MIGGTPLNNIIDSRINLSFQQGDAIVSLDENSVS